MMRQRHLVILLAFIGGCLLLIVAVTRWGHPQDEYAYWLAAQRLLSGAPLYDPAAVSNTPYAFWYPPIVAQVLAPVAAVLPAPIFSAAWTVLMLACLWWLAGRDVLTALALCAFPPVAVEFSSRNVHLILAVLLVLAIRGWSGWFSVAAAIKLAPGLGLIYLAVRRQWAALAVALGVGLGLLAASIVLSPSAWLQFSEVMLARGPADASTLLLIPYFVRLIAGVGLVILAARLEPRLGEPLLVVGVTVALPTLWFAAFSLLVAVVPLLRQRRSEGASGAPANALNREAT